MNLKFWQKQPKVRNLEVSQKLKMVLTESKENVNDVNIQIHLANGLIKPMTFKTVRDESDLSIVVHTALELYEDFLSSLRACGGETFFKIENVQHFTKVVKIEETYQVTKQPVLRKSYALTSNSA